MSCSFETADNPCGSAPYAPDKLDIIPLEACRKDLSDYLTNLGVSGSRGFGTQNVPVEYDVILNRAGLRCMSREDKGKMTICPKHRYALTTKFQKFSPYCSYPTHAGQRKKLTNPRRVNNEVSDEIYNWFKVSVPIGFGKSRKIPQKFSYAQKRKKYQ